MPPKSNWWKFFAKLDGANAKHARCRTCGKLVKHSGNTTNLKSHIENKHSSLLESSSASTVPAAVRSSSSDLRKPGTSDSNGDQHDPESMSAVETATLKVSQPTLQQSFKKITSFQEGSRKHCEITNSIVYMICKDNMPLTTVEKPGFLKLIGLALPHYKVPSRKAIKKLIEEKYTLLSDSFRTKFSSLQYFSLTTDIWTDTMQTRSFLGLTLHFSEGEKALNCNLGVKELDQRHNAQYIASKLLEICNEWNLKKENVACVVTDGASNMAKAVEIAFDKKNHIICFAHVINLVAQRALDSHSQVVEVITKVKRIVTWFKHSVVASDSLRRATELKLIQDVETRWNSTLYMIKRFVLLSTTVNEIILKHETAPPMMTASEIKILCEIQDLMAPLEMATREISGEKYVTSSLAIPLSYKISDKINATGVRIQTDAAKLLRDSVINELNKRLGSIEQCVFLAVATLLDPRFKKLYFKNPETISRAVRELKDMVKTSMKTRSCAGSGSDSESSSGEKGKAAKLIFHS